MDNEEWKKINVKDMSTQHIINTLRCIENGRINFIINMGWAVDNDYQEFDEDIETKKEWIRIFKNELEKRGSLDE